jgi:uncharacterized membrane protein (UPF0127 family)
MCFTKLMRKMLKYKHASVYVGSKAIDVLVADSLPKLMLGLMHMDSLGKSDGMLFIFGREARHRIWMLNMLFPIDIIWLSKQLIVVDIVEDAKPCSSIFRCKTYLPAEKALYVLELKAHTAKRLGIHKGVKLKLKL